jgi:hypothetical protein
MGEEDQGVEWAGGVGAKVSSNWAGGEAIE